jgi:hypothetical protein
MTTQRGWGNPARRRHLAGGALHNLISSDTVMASITTKMGIQANNATGLAGIGAECHELPGPVDAWSPAVDVNGESAATFDEVIRALNNALSGCPT